MIAAACEALAPYMPLFSLFAVAVAYLVGRRERGELTAAKVREHPAYRAAVLSGDELAICLARLAGAVRHDNTETAGRRLTPDALRDADALMQDPDPRRPPRPCRLSCVLRRLLPT